MKHSPEYRAYHDAQQRCTNPRANKYHRYGGRGIEFRFTSFEQFFKEVGKRPSSQHSIDRRDNQGHYEPGNVRWATRAEQMSTRELSGAALASHRLHGSW